MPHGPILCHWDFLNMTLDRFLEPTAADDLADCAGCQRTLHYEKLDDEFFCPECRACWCDEDVEAVNE